jgi:hypothetical protein
MILPICLVGRGGSDNCGGSHNLISDKKESKIGNMSAFNKTNGLRGRDKGILVLL